MDSYFWIGLGIGTVLSFLASIFANLANNKIQNWVEHRNNKTKLKRLLKERRTYLLVYRLYSGFHSQQFYFSRTTTAGVLGFVGGFITISYALHFMTSLRSTLKDRVDIPVGEMSVSDWALFFPPVLCIFASMFLTVFGSFIIKRSNEVGDKINNFKDYRKKLEIRYPQIQLEKIEQNARDKHNLQ